MMNTCNLFDVWRQDHPQKKQYTWHSNTKPCIHSRLDYFLVSSYMQNICKSSNITPGFKTDHCLISLKLNFNAIKRGPGYFKINNSILLRSDYQEQIRETITNTLQFNKDTNPVTFWDILKGNI